jgi:hypothetical protein
MERQILWTRSGRPEDAESAAVLVGFDRDDPDSVRRARAALKDALGLERAPPLCGPIRRGRLRRFARALRRAVRRA